MQMLEGSEIELELAKNFSLLDNRLLTASSNFGFLNQLFKLIWVLNLRLQLKYSQGGTWAMLSLTTALS